MSNGKKKPGDVFEFNSDASCIDCGYQGTVKDFEIREPRCIACGMTKPEGHAEDCGHIDCAPEMEDTHCFIKR